MSKKIPLELQNHDYWLKHFLERIDQARAALPKEFVNFEKYLEEMLAPFTYLWPTGYNTMYDEPVVMRGAKFKKPLVIGICKTDFNNVGFDLITPKYLAFLDNYGGNKGIGHFATPWKELSARDFKAVIRRLSGPYAAIFEQQTPSA